MIFSSWLSILLNRTSQIIIGLNWFIVFELSINIKSSQPSVSIFIKSIFTITFFFTKLSNVSDVTLVLRDFRCGFVPILCSPDRL